MSIEFKLPSIGEGVSSADIAEILVAPGDAIEADQVVMELETEKAVVELRCPHAGTIESLLVKAGDSIDVGQPLMTISGNGEAKDKDKKPAGKKAPAAKAEEKPAAAAEKSSAAATKSDNAKKSASGSKSAAANGESKSKGRKESPGGSQTIEFPLPSIGEGVAEADVAEVLVKPGDVIEANQVVVELETEKAVVELQCPHAGKITAVHVKAGDTIQVGANVLTIEATAEAETEEDADAESAQATAADAEESQPQRSSSKERPESKGRESTPARGGVQELVVPGKSPGENGSDGAPAPAAPSTRRLARELGVDLRSVRGSGPGGRITQEDVQSYVRNRLQGLSVPSGRGPASGAVLSAGSIAPPPLPDFTRFGPVERQALSKIGRVAAENLTVSWNVIPHVTQHDRADITDLELARKRFVEGLGKKGPKVTMTAIVIKALSTCLQAFPKFNSSLDPLTNEIVLKGFYNIGCAVDTEHGLVVPVIKDCHTKSILQIARDLNELAEKARDRKLPIDSMQGATCTVTNLGGIGGVGFTPIVNYPEVCILGMSRTQSELRMVEGQVEERQMLPLSLSYDHRVINGADAARFVATLCNMLADPFQLLTTI
ncbi:MAG: 2-oxo acid dehydrogenase subunit E2 [Planctomyces sp.]|nr:2-oxo acid dehydrogenase subunit E2 [Planctomyces sp.]